MNKILFLVILSVISFFIISCKSNTSEPSQTSQPPFPSPSDDFFPNKNETSYKFIIQVSDSSGILFSGSRAINYNGEIILDGTTYQIEKDSFELDRSNFISKSFFRKSGSGVFNFADTSGLELVIPDSLKQYLKVDKEQRLLFIPLSINQNWPIYKLNFDYSGFAFNVVNLFASVISVDTLNLYLNNNAQKKKSLKIKFNMIFQISPTSPSLRYEAYGWIVKDIGFVKWDGDAEVINFLLNENIFPPATNVKMDLSTYQF